MVDLLEKDLDELREYFSANKIYLTESSSSFIWGIIVSAYLTTMLMGLLIAMPEIPENSRLEYIEWINKIPDVVFEHAPEKNLRISTLQDTNQIKQ